MSNISIFEDVGGVTTELKDGKNVLNRRDLQPYVDKLREIEAATIAALANGQGYEFRTTTLSEHRDKAFNSFKQAARQLEEKYTVSIQTDNLPVTDGEQARVLFRIALTEKREDTPVTAAKKAFGVARRNLANRAAELQANPGNAEVIAAVKEQLTLTTKAAQEADKLVKAEAESQTADQLQKHAEAMQAMKVMVQKLTEATKDKAPAAKQ